MTKGRDVQGFEQEIRKLKLERGRAATSPSRKDEIRHELKVLRVLLGAMRGKRSYR